MIPIEIDHVFKAYINPELAKHGGNATPVDYSDEVVTIRMGGACRGCLSADKTVNEVIKKELQERCKDYPVKEVVISDEVHPELWEMAMKILNGEKPD